MCLLVCCHRRDSSESCWITFFLKPSSCSLYPLIRTETRVTESQSQSVRVCVGVFIDDFVVCHRDKKKSFRARRGSVPYLDHHQQLLDRSLYRHMPLPSRSRRVALHASAALPIQVHTRTICAILRYAFASHCLLTFAVLYTFAVKDSLEP